MLVWDCEIHSRTSGRKVFEIHRLSVLLFLKKEKLSFTFWTIIQNVLLQMPSSTLDTEIVIDRPPEIVKAVFMDWPLYP